MGKRDGYLQATNTNIPREMLTQFLSTYTPGKEWIELGCGAGNDAVHILSKGYTLLAIDKDELSEKIIREKIGDRYKDTFSFQRQLLGGLKLKPADVIYSSLTLPFVKKELFNSMMETITSNIKPGGYFVGNFFGPHDDWKNLVLCDEDTITGYFTGFDILDIKNLEFDERTAESENVKHWHEIWVIAQKKI